MASRQTFTTLQNEICSSVERGSQTHCSSPAPDKESGLYSARSRARLRLLESVRMFCCSCHKADAVMDLVSFTPRWACEYASSTRAILATFAPTDMAALPDLPTRPAFRYLLIDGKSQPS